MIKALVLYGGDVDPERYARHLPLARAVPADAFRHGRVFGAPFGEPEHRYFAEFEWSDWESFDAAMVSPEWLSSGKDAMAMGVPLSVEFAEVD